LLQLFSGMRKDFKSSGRGKCRGEINILLCGDPGTSKSQLLQVKSTCLSGWQINSWGGGGGNNVILCRFNSPGLVDGGESDIEKCMVFRVGINYNTSH
jgi:hypothetical protein